MPLVQPSAAALLLLSTAAVSFLGTAGATSGSPSSIPAAPATMQGDLDVNQQCSIRVWTMSKLQIYLVPCQDVSLRSRPVYLGALSENLHKVLIDLDDNTNDLNESNRTSRINRTIPLLRIPRVLPLMF